jgi:uncharacterized RDD family membrane protein YckC
MAKASRQGVYFEARDYAGFPRRLLLILVDFLALGLIFITLALVSASVPALDRFFWQSYLVICYFYLAVLKATSIGTIGYRAAGVRLITLSGHAPNLWHTTCRLGFLILGPLNLLLDLLTLQAEPDRQSFRDRVMGTFVVRRNAVPAGHGPICYRRVFWMSLCLTFQEVVREQENSDLELRPRI